MPFTPAGPLHLGTETGRGVELRLEAGVVELLGQRRAIGLEPVRDVDGHVQHLAVLGPEPVGVLLVAQFGHELLDLVRVRLGIEAVLLIERLQRLLERL